MPYIPHSMHHLAWAWLWHLPSPWRWQRNMIVHSHHLRPRNARPRTWFGNYDDISRLRLPLRIRGERESNVLANVRLTSGDLPLRQVNVAATEVRNQLGAIQKT